MSDQLSVAYVQAYSDNVIHLAQQAPSKFRMAARIKDGIIGKSCHFDRIAPTAAVKRTSRHAPTPLVNTQHSRVRVSLDDYDWGDLIDQNDDIRLLIDPTAEYTINAAKAMNRTWDDLLIAAFNAAITLVAADDTTSTSALAAANVIANGGTGLTVAKLRQAVRVLDAGDVDEADRFFAFSPIGKEDLLATTEVTSSDFNTVRALASGEIDTFLGMKFILTTRLPVAANIRSGFAWQKNAMGLAIGRDTQNFVEPRYDLNGATQVRFTLAGGATRVDNAGVVQVDFDESV